MKANLFFTKTRWLVTIILLLSLGISPMRGDVVLEFTTGSSDGNTFISDEKKAQYMTSASKDLCTISDVTRTYYYYSKAAQYGGPRGIKIGKSSSPTSGTATFNLASGSQITSTSIVVEASRYASDKSSSLSIAVNGGDALAAQTLSNEDVTIREYTFNFSSTTVTSVTINTTKYAYIKSITIKSAASCATAPTVGAPSNSSIL